MTTASPVIESRPDSGLVVLRIVSAFLGCAIVAGAFWLYCHFCSATTQSPSDVEAPSAPALEYIPDGPTIMEVD